MTHHARPFASRVLLASMLCLPVTTGPVQGTMREPSTRWTAVTCRSCGRAGIVIDTRRTIDSNGGAGSHALVRVRNRNPFDVIARVEFIAGDAVPEDGLVPSEQWNVDLGAVGASDAELVLILGRSDVTEAAVRAVQRY